MSPIKTTDRTVALIDHVLTNLFIKLASRSTRFVGLANHDLNFSKRKTV